MGWNRRTRRMKAMRSGSSRGMSMLLHCEPGCPVGLKHLLVLLQRSLLIPMCGFAIEFESAAGGLAGALKSSMDVWRRVDLKISYGAGIDVVTTKQSIPQSTESATPRRSGRRRRWCGTCGRKVQPASTDRPAGIDIAKALLDRARVYILIGR